MKINATDHQTENLIQLVGDLFSWRIKLVNFPHDHFWLILQYDQFHIDFQISAEQFAFQQLVFKMVTCINWHQVYLHIDNFAF